MRRSPRTVEVHRVYERGPFPEGVHRVLVDRLWPRGLTRQDVAFDEWRKDAAPTDGLRRWYRHDVAKFEEFASRYRGELATPAAAEAVESLAETATTAPLTLLTATRDVEHSAAAVLRDVLQHRLASR